MHDTMNHLLPSEGITLVIGGTGKTGRRVAERLLALGRKTRIASRSATPSFDWNDESTWDAALAGNRWVRAVGLVSHLAHEGRQVLLVLGRSIDRRWCGEQNRAGNPGDSVTFAQVDDGLRMGLHAKVVPTRLGYAQIGTTLDVYTDALPELDTEAANRLDAASTVGSK